MKVISTISTKGGVGKTTLTANLAGYLSSIDKKVLMIDADPQPSLSSYYKILSQASGGLTEIFVDPENCQIFDGIFGYREKLGIFETHGPSKQPPRDPRENTIRNRIFLRLDF